VTKYRRKVFTSKSLALIEKSFREVAEKSNFQVLEFNGESDHVGMDKLAILNPMGKMLFGLLVILFLL
jgi:hypothetical protein